MKKIIVFIAFVFISYGVYIFYDITNIKVQSSAPVLKEIPKVSFYDLQGGQVHLLEDFSSRQIDYAFIHFWGTWCAPCAAEFPRLVSYMQWAQKNSYSAVFYLVAVMDEIKDINKYIGKYDLPENAHILIDKKSSFLDAFGSLKVPETYVFKNAKTIRKYVGPQNWGSVEQKIFQLAD